MAIANIVDATTTAANDDDRMYAADAISPPTNGSINNVSLRISDECMTKLKFTEEINPVRRISRG